MLTKGKDEDEGHEDKKDEVGEINQKMDKLIMRQKEGDQKKDKEGYD